MRIQVILEPDITPDQLTELGLLAEQLGIHALWVQNYATAADPFMSLVPLALASKRIQLGVVIVSPLEMHPLKLATSLLTLNEFSRGRAAVVTGRGGEWLGIMKTEAARPLPAVQEALDIIRAAARGDGKKGAINFEGKVYHARYFRTPWLTQAARPIVYAGVTKERMLRMAARHADGVMLADLGMPSEAGKCAKVLNEELASSGRARQEFRINDFVGWHVKQDRDATFREARRELIIRAWLQKDWLTPFLSEEEADLVQRKKNAFLKAYRERTGTIEGVPQDIIRRLIDGLTITATADQLDTALERLRRFQAAGLDEIALRLHDDPADSIRLIGERVVPHFH
jgi:alkanesulfonate monooxygenase SsuD/methylene tetrahydromethanopterin reductase-like flavin-dependent oxidoreductase (luciferase family)